MSRRIVAIGALAAALSLAACGTPSVGDCQVACVDPGGACPDGTSCVEGMCRLEGASAACPAADGDAGSGDGAPGPDAGPVEVAIDTYEAVTRRPLTFAALQIGDEPWRLAESDDGRYRFIAEGRYGFAYVCAASSPEPHVLLSFFYATTAEVPAIDLTCLEGPEGPGAVTYEVQSVGGQNLRTWGAWRSDDGDTGSLPDLALGPHDVVATALGLAQDEVLEVAVERDVDVDGTKAVAVNLAGESFATDVAGIDVTGALGEDTVTVTARYLTTNGTSVALTALDGSIAAIPLDVLAADELHMVEAVASSGANNRKARLFARDIADLVIALPPVYEDVSASIGETTPYLRPRIQFPGAEGAIQYRGQLQQGIADATDVRDVRLQATGGWLGASSSYDWTAPDLSDLDGWDPAWSLRDTGEVEWFMGAVTATRSLADVVTRFDLPLCPSCRTIPSASWDGLGEARAVQFGTFTPPTPP